MGIFPFPLLQLEVLVAAFFFCWAGNLVFGRPIYGSIPLAVLIGCELLEGSIVSFDWLTAYRASDWAVGFI